jgi:dipeptidyl aminopeptidase/acylaminoacyl peptidase
MKPDDLYRLSWVDDPRVSPDGRTAAFVVWQLDREGNDYSAAIWLVPVDGSAPPRQFTGGPKQDVSPRWSPDGSRLAFTSKRDGDAKQLYVIPVSGGEPQRLTELAEDVAEVAWSPDGKRLAFSARVRDAEYEEEDEKRRSPRRFSRLQFKFDSEGWTGDRRRQLFTVPADGSGEATQYDGRGICYLEFGDDTVAKVDVTFASGQRPVGSYDAPSQELAAAKADFGTSRIQRWFGRTWP